MDVSTRNVALVSSVVYGVLLVCGWIFFSFAFRGEPLYNIRSPRVATFYVFLFSLLPSLFFLGGTVPWMCAAYGSEPAAIVFAVVPGGIFVLIALLWFFLGDCVLDDVPGEPFKFLQYRPGVRTARPTGPYADPAFSPQGVYGSPEARFAVSGAAGYSFGPTGLWTDAETERMLGDLRRQASQDPLHPTQPLPIPVLYGGGMQQHAANSHDYATFPPAGDGSQPWLGVPGAIAARLGDQSGTTAPVGYEGYLAEDPHLVRTPPPPQLVPSPFPTSPRSRRSNSSCRRRRSPSQHGDWDDWVGGRGGAAAATLFSARSPGDEEVYLEIPSSTQGPR